MQLEALLLVRNIKTAYIWSRDSKKTNTFVQNIKDKINIKIIACESPEQTVNLSEILITCTPSKSPIIKSEWLKKGLHITAMGSDAEMKNELDPKIIKDCDYYIPDSQSQTSILGELNHAIKAGLVSAEKKYNELGSVIINSNLGRRNINDVTVADLTGTGVQDTAIARHTYKISADKGFGKMIE